MTLSSCMTVLSTPDRLPPSAPDSPILTQYTITPPDTPTHTSTSPGIDIYTPCTTVAYHSSILNCDILSYTNKSLGIAYQLWESSAVLSTYIESLATQSYWCDKSVIELGSGCGSCSILLCKLGCKSVDCTDLSAAIPHLQHNLDINNIGHSNHIHAIQCNWGAELTSDIQRKQYDVIIGSDLLYWDQLFLPLLHTINQLYSHSPNIIMYLAQTPRRHKTESRFYKLLRKNNYVVEIVYTQKLQVADRQHVTIYKITKPIRTK